ncbi:hypothetical protein JAAARDRAFT_70079 [Jaapia argillacea MUCL 33604]|uniref:DUF6533 domain-containing protein n=1 Tax=Jaapia argillacea MUCL 33604 TaxID=933084 RepID=A0A067PTE9_9AGAM|nr:hypothetical protein JAAARDRAFT_70079 [Jaapia argillacea MUCL 33604]
MGDVDPRASRIIGSNSVGGLTFSIWDILITLDDEVNHIWIKRRSSWLKWLFLWTRYFGLTAQIANLFISPATTSFPLTPRFCKAALATQHLIADITMLISVDVILIIRLYALWDRKLWIAILLATCTSILVVVGLTGWTLSLQSEYAYGCDVVNEPYLVFYPLTILLALSFEGLILVLTLVRCLRFRRSRQGGSPIIFTMARDGIVAFFVVALSGVVNLIIYVVLDRSLSPVGYSWFLAMTSSAGCRLILSMQRLAPRSPSDMDLTGDPQFTTVLFDNTVRPGEESFAMTSISQTQTQPPSQTQP